jgi:hypothetical protein
MNYLEKSCEELDATVFSSDMMFDPERYAMFKRYLGRWNRAVEEHNKAEMTDATPPAAQRQWVGLTVNERMMCRSYDVDEAIAKTEAKLRKKNGGSA